MADEIKLNKNFESNNKKSDGMFKVNMMTNPVIRKLEKVNETAESENAASYSGIASKTAFFLAVTVIGAVLFKILHGVFMGMGSVVTAQDTKGIFELTTNLPELAAFFVVLLITIIFPLITWLIRDSIPVTGTIYCISQGYLIGFIANAFVPEYSWIASLAIVLTVVIVGVMLFLYAKRIVKVGAKFNAVIKVFFFSMVIGTLLMIIMAFIPGLRNIASFVNGILANPVVGIVVSAVFVVIAALFLLSDFDAIEKMVEHKLPKKYEWVGAYGLAFTVIWLYFKILNLLIKILGATKKS